MYAVKTPYYLQDKCDRLTAVACTSRRRQCLLLGLSAPARPCTLGYTNVVAVALAKTAATVCGSSFSQCDGTVRKCAFSPNCWGTGGG